MDRAAVCTRCRRDRMISIHQRYTVLISRLSKNSVDMVLHRVLREIEPGSNLLIGPTNKFNQLLFAPAEIRTIPPLQVLLDSQLLGSTTE